jgi:hypothetical protein
MPNSRKRAGHPYRKPADIPTRQRTRGRIVCSILFGVFGLVIAFFASDMNYIALVLGALIGSTLGYMVGKNLEQEATR